VPDPSPGASSPALPDPLFLATAIEAVLGRAASSSRRSARTACDRQEGHHRPVTEVDLAVERRFRPFIAERFPAPPSWPRNGRAGARQHGAALLI
jgi:hypothetical protein